MKFCLLGDDAVPRPKYIIRHERVGYSSRKLWTVRENIGVKKLVTVMGSKNEASRWIDGYERKNSRTGHR